MINSDKRYIPVEGHSGLFRDPSTNAIINIDKSSAVKNRQAREKILQRDADIENLKSDVGEIKALLKQLLER
jgi:hypothetical protein|tara:strand:- start:10825 stop:11040 length:216 start_codon:yes stop_codon:yes gene_type:complete